MNQWKEGLFKNLPFENLYLVSSTQIDSTRINSTWKPKFKFKTSMSSKTFAWNIYLENLCSKIIPLSNNSQKHSLLKTMNFQNLTHTFLLTLTHVKDVWNKEPLDKSVNFMWKHKHGPKLVSLSCFLCLSPPLTTFRSTLCWN
jgi:hypothetical protein